MSTIEVRLTERTDEILACAGCQLEHASRPLRKDNLNGLDRRQSGEFGERKLVAGVWVGELVAAARVAS